MSESLQKLLSELIKTEPLAEVQVFPSGQYILNYGLSIKSPWPPEQWKVAFDLIPESERQNVVGKMAPSLLNDSEKKIFTILTRPKEISLSNYVNYQTLTQSMADFLLRRSRDRMRIIFQQESAGAGVSKIVQGLVNDLNIEAHVLSLSCTSFEPLRQVYYYSDPKTWIKTSGHKIIFDLFHEFSAVEITQIIKDGNPQFVATSLQSLTNDPALASVLFQKPTLVCKVQRLSDGSRKIISISEVRKSKTQEFLEHHQIYRFQAQNQKDRIEGEFIQSSFSEFVFY